MVFAAKLPKSMDESDKMWYNKFIKCLIVELLILIDGDFLWRSKRMNYIAHYGQAVTNCVEAWTPHNTKISKGQEMVDKLTGLIAIFQRPEFDFKNNMI